MPFFTKFDRTHRITGFVKILEEMKIKKTRVNLDLIKVPEVRLIAADGKQVGIVTVREALRLSEEAELDLVEISPDAVPPVCRIMDYGKYLFELNKVKAAQRKKQKQIQIKEVKFRPGTDIGDYQIKLRKLIDFLKEGDKVKITVRFRGREMLYQDIGVSLLDRIEKDLSEYSSVEQRPKLEGRQLVMLFGPKKK